MNKNKKSKLPSKVILITLLFSMKTEPQPDAIYSSILNILHQFTGNLVDVGDKIRTQLMNLTCPTLSDFRWYKDVFLAKLFSLQECNNDFLKEKFISGLPKLFAEKVREVIRSDYNGTLLLQNCTYGDIIQTINQIGASLCNEMKLRKQIEQQTKISKYELGDFCYQYGFEPIISPSQTHQTKRKPNKKYRSVRVKR
eukprot:TRINITY_DN41860_c0_g1_i1.p2 TRINITY_DN41860_c0_g1~~TRINITY_DN41860_c0_g1_i1.p2  ORF type:complete len:197 (-),score=7.93 TRINITY_DN41860_c0_g1_i1:24-614(-)